MRESRCNDSRRFGTKTEGIPIERNTVKSLTPWAPSITPESVERACYGHSEVLWISSHHGETRLGQIAVVWRWYGGLKNKKAMCIYFSLVTIIHHSVTSIFPSKIHPFFDHHKDIHQPP